MKPTSRSALGFAVARIRRVATTVCHALRRSARPFAALAVLCATIGAATFCSATAAQTIAINFASENAALGSGDVSGTVGFTKTLTENERTLNLGKELPPSLWYASTGSNSNGTISVKGALETDETERNGREVSLTFSASGTYSSTNNKISGSLIGQLTHGYLDNGSNTQNSVSITGLPTTGYDVAVILSGDGYNANGTENTNKQNVKFSPIAINGVDYTADETNGTYPGDACWGKRDSSTSLTEGVNVLFVRNIMDSTLTLRGYYLNTTARKGRGTISAVMIFIHGTEGNEAAQTVSATATAESTVFSGTGLTWTNDAPETVTALGPATAATLALPSATTLALDRSVDLQSLALTGAGSLTFSTFSKGGLSASSTTVGADLDVSAKEFGASLGAVTVAADKTLTLRSLEQITSSTGSGILALCGNSTIANTTKLGSGIPLKVLSGTVTYTAGDSENGLSTGRFITVSGANSTLKTTTKDALGWNFPNADAQKLIIEQGGRLELGSRETLVTPIELCAGHIVLTTAEGDRALDFYDNNATRVDVTVKAADEGASAASPTVSTLSSTGSGDARKVNLRHGDLRVEVEENAKFEVSAQLISYEVYGSTLGKLVKLGDGVLELGGTTANTYTQGTEIQAGTVHLTGAATLGTGAATIASDAKLLVDGATDGTIKALTNTITGASNESIGTILLANNGVLDLRRALTGGTVPALAYAEGATGTLILTAGQETGVTIPEGAEARIVLSSAQLRSSYATTNTGNVTFYKETSSGALKALGANDGTFSEDGKTFTAVNVWTNAMGDGLWSTGGNWSTGEPPRETETVKVMVDAQTTLTLPESGVTVTNLTVEATTAAGALNLSGGKLTVSGTLTADAAVTATNSKLAYGTLAIQEGGTLSLTVAEGETYASGQLTGTGTLGKLGAGTLKFTTASGKACFADGVTVDVQAGKLFLYESDGAPTLKNAKLCFAEGSLWESYGWPNLEGTVTIEVVGSANTLLLGTSSQWGVSLAGSGTLVKTGEGTLQLPVKPSNGWSGNGEIQAGTLELLAANNGSSQEGTIGGVLSGSGKLKIGSGTVTLTRNNTYTGGTTIADGATVIVETIGKLGQSGTVQVDARGTLKLVNSSNLNETGTNYGRVEGAGTVWYSSSGGNYYRILPNTVANRLPTTISVRNDLTAGLIISQQGTNSPETAVGSVSGSGTFRADWVEGDNSRTLRIVQSKNTDHEGNFIHSSYPNRLTKVIVAGAAGAEDKTLTLSGSTTTTARPLEIEESGSVKLTGAWDAAITIDGALEVPVESGEKTISTALEGTTGTLTKSGAGTLKLTGANTFSGNVAITGGILNVGTNRGFTVSAIVSGAKLALTPTTEELTAGQITLNAADSVTLTSEMFSVAGFTGALVSDGVILLTNPRWTPTAGDLDWAHNWARGEVKLAAAPTVGDIEIDFSALTTVTEVTIPEGTFGTVKFIGGEAEGCRHVVTLGEGVTLGALTIGGRVTLPDTAITAATKIASGATLSLTGSSQTISTAITGEGALHLLSGVLTLSGANTYTGGTIIDASTEEQSTELVMTTNAAFPASGAVTGEGTLHFKGNNILPTTANGRFAGGWTGTVKFSGSGKNDLNLNHFGTGSSKIEFAGASGYFPPGTLSFPQEIILSGNGWTTTNGYAGHVITFSGPVSGSGALNLNSTAPANGLTYKFTGKLEAYKGALTVGSIQWLVIGSGAILPAKGTVNVTTSAVVAGTWKATNGITVTSGTLSGGGTLDSAVTVTSGGTLSGVTCKGAVTCQSSSTVVAGTTFTGSVTFAGGAKLQARAANASQVEGRNYVIQCASTPTFLGTVSVSSPDYNLSVIKAPGLTEETFTVDAASEKTDLFLRLIANGDGTSTLMALCKPSIPEAPAEMSEAEKTALAECIVKQFVEVMFKHGIASPVSAVADSAKPNAKVEGALLFENVVKPTTNAEADFVAVVSYDFGVADITIKDLTLGEATTPSRYVVLSAKVESTATTGFTNQAATFAEDVIFTVTVDGTALSATAISAAELGLTEEANKKWFAVPFATVFPEESPTGTKNFRVKVSKEVN